VHPAKSVILFTTASGAGYGLLCLLALLDLVGAVPPGALIGPIGVGLALALVTVGLISSTYHLGHPERAWRALSQWRSSWLSREGVAALLSYLPALAYGIGRWLYPEATAQTGPVWLAAAAWGSAGLALVTIICTAMIYASLKPVPAWRDALVVPGYILMALATGGVLLNALAHLFGFLGEATITSAAVALVLAMAAKMLYWRRIRSNPATSTAESATGLTRDGKVRLLEGPHDGSSYLMREMGFRIARRHAGRLRRIAVIWGFLFPLLGLTMIQYNDGAGSTALVLVIAVIASAVGTLAERYLFFAEAKHAVTLYYGETAV
jgi:DMSO reductase anchor subunit